MAEGRDQRRRSDKGHRRLPRMGKLYSKRLRDIVPGEFEFRTLLIRPEKRAARQQQVRLDAATTYITWTDDGPVLTGSLTLKRPKRDAPHSIPIRRGHLVRLLVRWHARWYRLWDMRVNGEPRPSLMTGDVNVELADDLDALRRNDRDWSFRKTKQRKKGWRPHEIAKRVCRREGAAIGRLAHVEDVWIEKLEQDATSGLEMIRKAYAQAGEKTGRRYVIRFRRGRLEVLPLARSQIAYVVKGVATSADLESTPRHLRPRTVIVGTAKIGGEKVEVELSRRAVARRFGRSVLEKDYGELDSRAELREELERELARQIKVKRTAIIGLPCIPFLERGSTVRWISNEPGWYGPSENSRDRSWAYVRRVTHSVGPQDQTSQMTLEQFDPYLADRRRRDREARDERRREREGRRQ